MTRELVRPISCLALLVALVGCGSSDTESSTRVLDLAFIPKTSNNLVFKMGNDGAQFGARDLSKASGLQVKVDYMASPELDPAAEQALIRQAITEKKDGIIVSCVDDSITAPINEAVNAGIPVITYDSDCPTSHRLGFYSMQSEVTGAQAAELLATAMGPGTKKIAILTGRAGADNLERRVNGFMTKLATYPQISVAATIHCEETADSCSSAVEEDIVSQHPDLDGLLVVGLWGVQNACSCNDAGTSCICNDTQMPKWKAAAKGKLKTVAFDSLPFELTLMGQGYITALLGQKYFGWGYDTVSLMHGYLTAGTQVGAFIDSGFDVVCPNNLADMNAKWQSSDFRAPLTPGCAL